MNKNPYLNAILAGVYIVIVALGMTTLSNNVPGPDTVVTPMVVLSMLVLSVAVMGYLFVFEPTRLLMDGQKKESATFLAKMIGSFAVIVVVFLVTLVLYQ